jgi:RNA polymerase sigma factor (TIGR02999 family)
MGSASAQDITGLLRAWSQGDASALEKLTPLVYGELRRRARRYVARERPDHTLQSSDLVNEVFIRLLGSTPVGWRDRSHFFALSAHLMRRILVDHARTRGAQTRGGGRPHVTFDEGMAPVRPAWDLVRLDDALDALSAVDERKSRVVEMRFFGGLGVEETAEVLGVSPRTVRRDWHLAKAWLLRQVERGGHGDGR